VAILPTPTPVPITSAGRFSPLGPPGIVGSVLLTDVTMPTMTCPNRVSWMSARQKTAMNETLITTDMGTDRSLISAPAFR
jgi:hypothetical protein